MNLIFDIGNSKIKCAVADSNTVLEHFSSPKIKIEDVEKFIEKYSIKYCIVSSVRKKDDTKELFDYLKSKFKVHFLGPETKLPFENRYLSPESLGQDRIAVVSASQINFKNENRLIIQIGTCITYDFIDCDNTYHGGAISPGLSLRFKSLNAFTGNLPLVKYQNFNKLLGANTEESILSGVINGMRAEIDGIIDEYSANYENLRIIMTGGGANSFEKILKNKIFAVSNFVILGLNYLLDFNEEIQ